MKIKFTDLNRIETQPVPLSKKPVTNKDHAIISYITMRNDELNISVSATELEQIEFSKDFKYMQLPPFLEWKKGSKGPYLVHTSNSTVETSANTTIDW